MEIVSKDINLKGITFILSKKQSLKKNYLKGKISPTKLFPKKITSFKAHLFNPPNKL